MPYATRSDMQQRYGDAELQQLSDIVKPRTGDIVDSVLDRALQDASAWIDSYLVGRYPLPIADAAALVGLKLHCVAEARFLLMTAHPDDSAIKAHEERERFFSRVAKGEISLIAPTDVPAAAGAGSVVFLPGGKVFAHDETAGDSFGRGDCRGDSRGGW